jgi:hypothetical protein
MKKNQLNFILVGVFFLSTLASVGLAVRYSRAARKFQEMQITLIKMQNTQNFIQQLYAESVDYGKRNPAIQPVLTALTNGSAFVESAPATHPAAK